MRPRRLRDASTLWGALRAKQGNEARDGVWMHPDLLPTADDLDEPLDFVGKQGTGSGDQRDADGQDEFDRLTAGLDLQDPSTAEDDGDGDGAADGKPATS